MTEEKPCQLCGGVTFQFVTMYASYRVCRSCGERVTLKPQNPPPTIRDISQDRTEEALNELSKLQYDDERIHELGG